MIFIDREEMFYKSMFCFIKDRLYRLFRVKLDVNLVMVLVYILNIFLRVNMLKYTVVCCFFMVFLIIYMFFFLN